MMTLQIPNQQISCRARYLRCFSLPISLPASSANCVAAHRQSSSSSHSYRRVEGQAAPTTEPHAKMVSCSLMCVFSIVVLSEVNWVQEDTFGKMTFRPEGHTVWVRNTKCEENCRKKTPQGTFKDLHVGSQ